MVSHGSGEELPVTHEELREASSPKENLPRHSSCVTATSAGTSRVALPQEAESRSSHSVATCCSEVRSVTCVGEHRPVGGGRLREALEAQWWTGGRAAFGARAHLEPIARPLEQL